MLRSRTRVSNRTLNFTPFRSVPQDEQIGGKRTDIQKNLRKPVKFSAMLGSIATYSLFHYALKTIFLGGPVVSVGTAQVWYGMVDVCDGYLAAGTHVPGYSVHCTVSSVTQSSVTARRSAIWDARYGLGQHACMCMSLLCTYSLYALTHTPVHAHAPNDNTRTSACTHTDNGLA